MYQRLTQRMALYLYVTLYIRILKNIVATNKYLTISSGLETNINKKREN